MKLSTCTLLLAASLSFASCDSLPSGIPGMPGGGGNDMVNAMKDTPTTYMMKIPAGATVGDWWEVDQYGTKLKNAVVAEKDGNLIVEQTGGEVIQAFAIDPTVDVTVTEFTVGEAYPANVVAAWVGTEGKKPVARPVMDAPKYEEPTGAAAAAAEVEFTEGDEQVTVDGKTFNAHWMQTPDMKMWTEKSSGFDIKMNSQGKTISAVTAWGTDAKPTLDWTPEAK